MSNQTVVIKPDLFPSDVVINLNGKVMAVAMAEYIERTYKVTARSVKFNADRKGWGSNKMSISAEVEIKNIEPKWGIEVQGSQDAPPESPSQEEEGPSR